MLYSSAATLSILASLAHAAPTIHPREHARSYELDYGAKYQSQIFYTNWLCSRMVYVTNV
jgi:hypothetical protein